MCACWAYAQSDQSLSLSLEYSMSVKLLTEHHLEFLSLKVGWTGSSESTLSCQNTTLLEVTCYGSFAYGSSESSSETQAQLRLCCLHMRLQTISHKLTQSVDRFRPIWLTSFPCYHIRLLKPNIVFSCC